MEVYVQSVTSLSRRVFGVAKYLYLVLLAILMVELITRVVYSEPSAWTIESGLWVMTGMYMLGGAHSLVKDRHVRMDAFYERWPEKRQSIVNLVTLILGFVYLVAFVRAGVVSSLYALEVGQTTVSAWKAPLAPVKIVMTAGAFLMLLQCSAFFVGNLLKIGRKQV